MKRLLCVTFVLFFVACGDDESPPLGGNNTNPNNANNTNNTNNLNNANNANNGASCAGDQECAAGFACVESVCQGSCSDTRTCRADQECVPQPDGEGSYCVPASNNRPMNNTNNGTNNGTNNTNSGPPELILLADETTDAAACASDEPGADIYWVGLQDEQGAAIGVGTLVSAVAGSMDGGNKWPNTGHLDGSVPAAPMCPANPDPQNLYSMGCSGQAVFRFLDMNGGVVPLMTGYTIVVTEYGSQCDQSAPMDVYRVAVCTDTQAVTGGQFDSCSVEVIADGSDRASGAISIP